MIALGSGGRSACSRTMCMKSSEIIVPVRLLLITAVIVDFGRSRKRELKTDEKKENS